jgi:hypothetical protein
MKRYLLVLSIFATAVACNNNQKASYSKAADAEEAGREFVRASLDGDYEKANFYLYQDSTNTNSVLLDRWRKDYNSLSAEDKVNYKQASIIALGITALNDSAVNYKFTNSFKSKDTTTLKIVRIRGEWLVDFLRTFIDK